MSIDLDPDAAGQAAAEFLASPRACMGQLSIDEVRMRFGVTTDQALEAMRIARSILSARAA